MSNQNNVEMVMAPVMVNNTKNSAGNGTFTIKGLKINQFGLNLDEVSISSSGIDSPEMAAEKRKANQDLMEFFSAAAPLAIAAAGDMFKALKQERAEVRQELHDLELRKEQLQIEKIKAEMELEKMRLERARIEEAMRKQCPQAYTPNKRHNGGN